MHHFTTDRLTLDLMAVEDAPFMFQLVNTPGWLTFIGDRKVYDLDAANAYVHKLRNTPNANSWVVRLKDEQTPVGVISFLQRDYLEHRDIGFAFLPEYNGHGYAFEAAAKILQEMAHQHPRILATALPANAPSVRLLEKLGLQFEKMIRVGEEDLRLYAIQKESV